MLIFLLIQISWLCWFNNFPGRFAADANRFAGRAPQKNVVGTALLRPRFAPTTQGEGDSPGLRDSFRLHYGRGHCNALSPPFSARAVGQFSRNLCLKDFSTGMIVGP
jgi:hypothetical protein